MKKLLRRFPVLKLKLIRRLALIQFLSYFVFYEGIEKLFMLDIGISLYGVGLVAAWITGAQFLFEIPTGVMADKIGRKRTLLIAKLTLIAGSLIMWQSDSLTIFIAGSSFIGLTMALESGTFNSYALDVARSEYNLDKTDNDRRSINGLMQAANLLGLASAALLSGFIAEQVGLRDTYIYSIIPIIFAYLLLLRMKDYREITYAHSQEPLLSNSIRLLFKNKTLQATLVSTVLLITIGRATGEFSQVYFAELDYDVRSIGVLFGLTAAAGGIGYLLASSDFTWVNVLSRYGLLLAGAGLLLVGYAPYQPVVVAFVSVVAIRMIAGTWLEAIQFGAIESHRRSTVMSVLHSFSRAILLVTIQIFGIISDMFGIFFAFGALGAISAAIGLGPFMSKIIKSSPTGLLSRFFKTANRR